MTIRVESQSDHPLIRVVHCAAFPTSAEADLVDRLRTNGNLLVSLAAFDGSQLIGHVAFSPVTIADAAPVGAGLAPVGVLPSHQQRGHGARLIQAGVKACRDAGTDYIVVLGEPSYYMRFGFGPASQSGLENEYGAGDEFMVIELTPNCLAEVSGLVRYSEEFQSL